MKECANIIVTYNRKNLLKKCVSSLLQQTYKNHDILIIDNASTDGTEEYVRELYDTKIKYFNTGTNSGGAGGFAFGLKKAMETGYKYAWLMDDDSIPDMTALESLVAKAKLLNNKFSFLCSLVYWKNNKVFPMNYPGYIHTNLQNYSVNILTKFKLIPISTGSFVGCFINLDIGKKVGLPISEFFIYGDDVEYTIRLRKENFAYLDLESTILHNTQSNNGADIISADANKIHRFFYQSRNGMYIARKEKKVFTRIILILQRTLSILKKAPNKKLHRLKVLYKGSIFGLFFNPKIKFPETASKHPHNKP